MAISATIYRVNFDLSDIDRNVYTQLEFRIAQHPSESSERLMARIIAYGLFYEDGLEFGRGISSADEPALWIRTLTGEIVHWIDLGAPSADRIHLASKKAPKVSIVTYKGMDALSREIGKKKIHRGDEIDVLELDPKVMLQLGEALSRTTQLSLVHAEGDLNISLNDLNVATTVTHCRLPGHEA
jgi:uncharacterized protein YaeQ